MASVLSCSSQEATEAVKQSHLSVSLPGMLQWLNLATSRCQQNPQVTSGRGPQTTSCPPWHSFYLPLFKRIHISCVFYIVCDFLEPGVPLPPYLVLHFLFVPMDLGPRHYSHWKGISIINI